VNVTAKLFGVLPVVQTPYLEDETIDRATFAREVDWLFSRGANGLVLAMVSEVLRLSTDEREELATLACHSAAGRGPVVISVGAESSKVAERLACHAESCGAAAVMAIPPLAAAVTEEELIIYYRRIFSATALPVIVQDASSYVGRPMSIGLLSRLLDEHGPERTLFKPEATPLGPRLSQLRDATRRQAKVFEGSGGIALLDSFRRGIVGTMPGADLIDGIVALWRALVDRRQETAQRISEPLSALVALQSGLDGFLAVEKYLLVKQGVFVNEKVRGPTGYRLDDETRAAVDVLFARLTDAIHATETRA
jgi:4-hydroxy-tetrahydrodipicolinate synthase